MEKQELLLQIEELLIELDYSFNYRYYSMLNIRDLENRIKYLLNEIENLEEDTERNQELKYIGVDNI